jgi:hypothetical protein
MADTTAPDRPCATCGEPCGQVSYYVSLVLFQRGNWYCHNCVDAANEQKALNRERRPDR